MNRTSSSTSINVDHEIKIQFGLIQNKYTVQSVYFFRLRRIELQSATPIQIELQSINHEVGGSRQRKFTECESLVLCYSFK